MSDTRASDWEDFDDVLETLVNAIDEIPEYAREFVESVQARHAEWGDSCFISEKQWKWMLKLRDGLG